MMAVLVAVMVAAFSAVGYAKIVVGTNADDELEGTPNPDQLNGLWGDDVIVSKGGTDEAFGGRGEDKIYGNRGMDDVNGGPGFDKIYGGRQADSLQAADGFRDVVNCGPGLDEAFADISGPMVDNISDNCEFVNNSDARPTT
jgi:Ca2+-binding RTX toxin-like protein